MRNRRSSPVPATAALWAIGVVEAVSFVALVVTAFSPRNAGVRAGLGFLHGCVYLLSLALAWWWVDDNRARGLAVIPGIGALLLARRVTHPPGRR